LRVPEERHRQECLCYSARLDEERSIYRDCLEVHDLPAIFHYWSNRYVRPKLEALGFSSPDEMFRKYAAERCLRGGSGPRRLASVGAGNCELEIGLAAHLRAMGCGEVAIDCLELNAAMLERGQRAADEAGVGDCLDFIQMDLNEWTASQEYDVVIANQTLHHVLNLENLFDQIGRSLKPEGAFITSDMIGRNGHQRWPEALDMVQEFWRKLPPAYRYNRRMRRYEEAFEDHDCSSGNFEGIRAQDILPLLVERFHFEMFTAYANVIDPFVDRTYGGNFDADSAWDRNFIDQVNERDEKEIVSGRIKPTHMLAVMGKDASVATVLREPLSPAFCLRDPSRVVESAGIPAGYEWEAWPHNPQKEIEIGRRLKESADLLKESADRLKRAYAEAEERTQWALRVDGEIERARGRIAELEETVKERTAWAQQRDRDIDEITRRCEQLEQALENRTGWAMGLAGESQVRTEWATGLERDLERYTARVRELQRELQERTEWARGLDRQMERLAWALPLDRRLHGLLDRAFRAARAVHSFFRWF